MNLKMLFSLMAVAVIAGCASGPKRDVYSDRGAFRPGIDLIMQNELDSGAKPTELIWLNASRIHQGPWDATYYLEVRYEALPQTGWLGLGPGETLELTVDGETIRFSGMGGLSERTQTSAGTFLEHALYEASPDSLRKIARAREVKVDIKGRTRTIHREFNEANTEQFRTFVLNYLGYRTSP